MRMILLAVGATILAGCTTPNMNNGDQQRAAATSDEPRTPDIFRKPPKQVGKWGNGVGYGGRF